MASATWPETITITSGDPRHFLVQISISAISLFISDGVAHRAQRSSARYSVAPESDNDIIFSSAVLLSSNDGTAGATQAELNESGTVPGGDALVDGRRMRVNFAPFDARTASGDCLPNGSLTAVYRLEVGMESPGLEVSADASLGDPFTLQGMPIGFASSATAVSLPAAVWLLAPGLAALGPFARRHASFT